MDQDQSTPKLHVDTDWKAEAQAEKERLIAQEKAREETRAPGERGKGPREMPEASFQTLVSVLAAQAYLGLGGFQDPETKGVMVDLEGARFSIDLLQVLEDKTKGSLTDEEAKELTHVLAELRARFVQMTQLIAAQMARGEGTKAQRDQVP